MRHGETDWSRSGRHTGLSDIVLTREGRDQAESARSRLKSMRLRSVWTSPLMRARETASLAGFPDALVSPDLVEWDYGSYEGRTALDIRNDAPGWEIFRDGAPNAEPLSSVARRADRVVAAVRDEEGDVLVVSHGHMLRVLAARWLGLDPQFGRTFAAGPASLSVLGWKRDTPVVLRWNDACHLEDEWCDHALFPD